MTSENQARELKLSLLEEVLRQELVELKYINQFIKAEVEVVNAEFPKQCSLCYRFFDNLEHFRESTVWEKERSCVSLPSGVLEFRNCSCGTTLTVKLQCRRAEGKHADRRRQLFAICIEKSAIYFCIPQTELRDMIRTLFNKNTTENNRINFGKLK